MSNLPTGPYFSYHRRRHAIDFCPGVAVREHVTRLTLLKDQESQWEAFDSAGGVWTFRYERPSDRFSIATRLLAYTVYNPVCEVSVIWRQVRCYQLSELRQPCLDALDHDDDVLTQFVDGAELRCRIEKAESFDDFVATWKWMLIGIGCDANPV